MSTFTAQALSYYQSAWTCIWSSHKAVTSGVSKKVFSSGTKQDKHGVTNVCHINISEDDEAPFANHVVAAVSTSLPSSDVPVIRGAVHRTCYALSPSEGFY